MTTTEQRSGARVDASLPAHLQIGDDTARGEIVNLSAWGACFEGAFSAPVGARAVLAREGAKGVWVAIAWKKDGECGLRFVGPVRH
jgi:hypothetical protein